MGLHARNAAICRLKKPNAPEKVGNYAHNKGSLMAVGVTLETKPLLVAVRKVLSDGFELVSVRTVPLPLIPRRDRATRRGRRRGST